jgi:hypothetical protein
MASSEMEIEIKSSKKNFARVAFNGNGIFIFPFLFILFI